ncbi:MAG TPA: DUF4911 domain-containing protein, partial [Polyangiaceae bacterium]
RLLVVIAAVVERVELHRRIQVSFLVFHPGRMLAGFLIRSRALRLAELLDPAFITRQLRVRNEDVVFVKGIFEASEGLCVMFAERGGELTLLVPVSRARELDVVLNDLAVELNGMLDSPNGTGC